MRIGYSTYDGSLFRRPLLPCKLFKLVLDFDLEVIEGRRAGAYSIASAGMCSAPHRVADVRPPPF